MTSQSQKVLVSQSSSKSIGGAVNDGEDSSPECKKRQTCFSGRLKSKDSSTLPSSLSPQQYEDFSPPPRKRRKFWGFRSLVKMLRKRKLNRKRSSASSFDLQTSTSPIRAGNAPYNQTLSVSHDSVFHPDSHSECAASGPPILPGSSSRLNIAELKAAIQKRCADSKTLEDDSDDLGLPRSPPTTSPTTLDVLNHGLKNTSHQGQSSCSDGSLLSIGSSEYDDESYYVHSWHSSKQSLSESRHHAIDKEPTLGATPILSHQAAKHKIAIRPKKTRATSRKVIQSQGRIRELPSTPEVNESVIGSSPCLRAASSSVTSHCSDKMTLDLSSEIHSSFPNQWRNSSTTRELSLVTCDFERSELIRSSQCGRVPVDARSDSSRPCRGRRSDPRKSLRQRSDPFRGLVVDITDSVAAEEPTLSNQRSLSVEGRIEGNCERGSFIRRSHHFISSQDDENQSTQPSTNNSARWGENFDSDGAIFNAKSPLPYDDLQMVFKDPAVTLPDDKDVSQDFTNRRLSSEEMIQTSLPGIYIRSNNFNENSQRQYVDSSPNEPSACVSNRGGEISFQNSYENPESQELKQVCKEYYEAISSCKSSFYSNPTMVSINDGESTEKHQPVILRSASARSNSSDKGRFKRERQVSDSSILSCVEAEGHSESSKVSSTFLNFSPNPTYVSTPVQSLQLFSSISDNKSHYQSDGTFHELGIPLLEPEDLKFKENSNNADKEILVRKSMDLATSGSKDEENLNDNVLSKNEPISKTAYKEPVDDTDSLVNSSVNNSPGSPICENKHLTEVSKLDSQKVSRTSLNMQSTQNKSAEIVLRRPSVIDKSVLLDRNLSSSSESGVDEDQPELFKVFARRSLKLSDSEIPSHTSSNMSGNSSFEPLTSIGRRLSSRSSLRQRRSPGESDEMSKESFEDLSGLSIDQFKTQKSVSTSFISCNSGNSSVVSNASCSSLKNSIRNVTTPELNASNSENKSSESLFGRPPLPKTSSSAISRKYSKGSGHDGAISSSGLAHEIQNAFSPQSAEIGQLRDFGACKLPSSNTPGFDDSCDAQTDLDHGEVFSANRCYARSLSFPSPSQRRVSPHEKFASSECSSHSASEPISRSFEVNTSIAEGSGNEVTEARNLSVTRSFISRPVNKAPSPVLMRSSSTSKSASASPESGVEDWRAIAKRRKELRMKQTKTEDAAKPEESSRENSSNRNSKVLEMANNFQKLQVA